jgi:hypothetical protein
MNAFSLLTLDDIERYSKRYMKVYKEEWVPGTIKLSVLLQRFILVVFMSVFVCVYVMFVSPLEARRSQIPWG